MLNLQWKLFYNIVLFVFFIALMMLVRKKTNAEVLTWGPAYPGITPKK